MVKIALQISCAFENIEFLKAGDGFSYFIKIRCMNCGESDNVWHPVCEDDRVQESTRNAKGSNFLIKCKLCSRENSIDIVEGSQGTYTEDDAGKFKTFVAFDCRGVEPESFEPRDGFVAKAIDNGQTFDEVEFEDGDWTEYCSKNNNSVSISEFQSQFVKVKGK
jgi:ribosomal protein S27E